MEDIGLHLVGGIGRGHFVHADGDFAIADRDTSFGLAQAVHQHQHLLLAYQGYIAVGINIVYRRRLWQTGQEGRLGE